MFFTFLEFGTIWFWLVSLVSFGLLIACVESEKSGRALALIVSVATAFILFGDQNIVPWIVSHPLKILEYTAGYVITGIVWGFVKWYFYLLKARDRIIDYRTSWIERNGAIDDTVIAGVPGNNKTRREQFEYDVAHDLLSPRIPTAKSHSGCIIFWMSYWPASAVWTLINDPFTRFFKFIYNRIVAMFESIAHAMFKDLKNEFKTK